MNLLIYTFSCWAYWAWCVLFFVFIQKSIFVILNRKRLPETLNFKEIMKVYSRGVISDAIVASYLSVIPFLLLLLHALIPSFRIPLSFFPYNTLLALVIGLLSLSDAILYGYWEAKIDSSVFDYLHEPKGIFASVSVGYVIMAVIGIIFVSAAFWCGLEVLAYFTAYMWEGHSVSLLDCIGVPILFVVFCGLLFMIIRGLKIRPNNPSVVYFSPKSFLNHWALNPGYSLIYSFGTRNEFAGKFRSMPDEECQKMISEMFPVKGTPSRSLLKTDRPNILTIVWESFGADYCGAVGGRKGISPCFDRLAEEGVLFTNCRASSFRTDRAFPAIFCGLPGQPTTSIVRHTRKLPNLPAFPRKLREMGYETTSFYGGDLTIMHQSDFFLASGHSQVYAQKDIPFKGETGKWGIHDGDMVDPLFNRLVEIDKKGNNWLATFQTLSSHEPFIVPYSRLENKEDNAMAYADESIGRLVEKLKNSPLWDNLLIMIVADHGLNIPSSGLDRNTYSHIPLLWTGGAVKGPCKVDTVMTQTDIPAVLLSQMGLDHSDYPYSRDILADTYTYPFSFHTYINGFFFSDETGYTDFDNVSEAPIGNSGDSERERKGKAIMQSVYEYIDRL